MHSPLPPRQHPPSRAGKPTRKPPAPRSATAMGACTSSVGWFRPRPPQRVCPSARQADLPIEAQQRALILAGAVSPSTSTSNSPAPRRTPQHPPAYALAITLDREPPALRSTRNRPRTAVQGCVLGPLCAGVSRKQPPSKETAGERSRRSTPVQWAWLDLNQRPHPYQVSRAQRRADRRFPRSPLSVRGEGMRSKPPRSRAYRQCTGRRK
jgi:hypothetical protein